MPFHVRFFCAVALALSAVCILSSNGAGAQNVERKRQSKQADSNGNSEFSPDQSELPAEAPEGATLLFDGNGVNLFTSMSGGDIDWQIDAGELVSGRGQGRSNHLVSKLHFRDADIHVEFKLPDSGSGNSGIYIHGNYELQIINSYGKKETTQGDMGAVYGFAPPLVNASRPSGEWQVYDIRYRAPRRDADGEITQEGSITAWLNGHKIQDGTRVGEPRSKYHPYRYGTTDYLQTIWKQQKRNSVGPVFLQDHDNPVRFRNVWVRPLDEFAALHAPDPKSETTKRPNVLLIMADDLGFSDLGCYGGEIKTPNLDRLAEHGLRFTQFCNTARCWPTRAALLTGYYAQQVRRDSLPGLARGNRPEWARLLPDMLRPQGYRSYHSGKWHIDGMPLEMGFDRSYYLKDQGRFFNPKVHHEDDKKLPPVKPDSGYYGTTAIADHAIRALKDHQQKHSDRPFFHYLAFTAPHFPLHALPEDIARYNGVYDRGWNEIRAARFERIRKLGLVNGKLSDVEREVGPPYHFPEALKILGPGEVNRPLPWSDLTDEQKKFQATKMAIHAAMIDRMDQEIGRVLDQLKAMDAFDDTLIFFLSDNGASAEIMVRTDGHDPSVPPGSAKSYLCLGPGWSTACNTPFRRHKTWVHQGGISTPLIAHWPSGIKARGDLRRNPGHVIDIVPTILELAGAQPFEEWNDKPVPAAPGKSLVPVFGKDHTVSHKELWWSHEGHRALRKGDWKLVAAKGDPWELYDLSKDPTETNNVAAKHGDVVRSLEERWTTQADGFVKSFK